MPATHHAKKALAPEYMLQAQVCEVHDNVQLQAGFAGGEIGWGLQLTAMPCTPAAAWRAPTIASAAPITTREAHADSLQWLLSQTCSKSLCCV